MFGAAREWKRVNASLEKRVVSETMDDGRDPMAYGDRGILSLCSISRCSMSAVGGVSLPCGGGVFRWGEREQGERTYETAEMVRVYMFEGDGERNQFRLRFHPPIVGSAPDVCEWDSQPTRVQRISVKTNVRPLPFDRPAPAHVIHRSPAQTVQFIPKPHRPPSHPPSGADHIQSLSQQWPQNSSVCSSTSEEYLGLTLPRSRIPMKSRSST